jgi:hypothetical protein
VAALRRSSTSRLTSSMSTRRWPPSDRSIRSRPSVSQRRRVSTRDAEASRRRCPGTGRSRRLAPDASRKLAVRGRLRHTVAELCTRVSGPTCLGAGVRRVRASPRLTRDTRIAPRYDLARVAGSAGTSVPQTAASTRARARSTLEGIPVETRTT